MQNEPEDSPGRSSPTQTLRRSTPPSATRRDRDSHLVRFKDERELIRDITRTDTSSAAPPMDMSPTMQLTAVSANSIAPDISTRLRGSARLSMSRRYGETLMIYATRRRDGVRIVVDAA